MNSGVQIYIYIFFYTYFFPQSSQKYTPKLMKNLCLRSWQQHGMIQVLMGARTNTFGAHNGGRILNLVRISTFRSRHCLYAYPCIPQTYGWETRWVSFPKHMVSFSVFPFCLMRRRIWCAVSYVFQLALHLTRSSSTRMWVFFFLFKMIFFLGLQKKKRNPHMQRWHFETILSISNRRLSGDVKRSPKQEVAI